MSTEISDLNYPKEFNETECECHKNIFALILTDEKREQRNAQTEELTEGCNFGGSSMAQSN